MFGGFSALSAAEEIEARRPLVPEEEKPEAPEGENMTEAASVTTQLGGLSLDNENSEPPEAEEFTKEDLTMFLTAGKEDLISEETKADLIQKRKDRGHTESARDILYEQQQETWKTLGRDKNAGMEAVADIQTKFEDDEELCELHKDYMKCTQQAFVDMIRGSKPETLQTEGKLTKAQILDFFEGTNCLMGLEETKQRLEEKFREIQTPPNELVIEMQHDMLENLGIGKDFGVSMLNRINQDFPGDIMINSAMREFAQSTQIAVREAVVGREAMAKQLEAMKKLQKQQREIIAEIQAMSDEEVEEFMKRVKDTMMSHMQVMQQMQPADRMRYMQGLEKEEQREMMKFQMILQANTPPGHSHGHSHAPGGNCTGDHSHGGHSHGHSYGGDNNHSHDH
mmetsp:Transcript_38232/g.49315  ORF Transcript_38232/g.49315 Transcript_38232/m.49315 type:complete len:396 (+) Transcript_38232:119-1306(+)